MLDPQARITSATERPQIQSNGSVKTTVVYTYYVGDFGPFTAQIALGADSAAEVAKVINDQAAKLRQLGAIK